VDFDARVAALGLGAAFGVHVRVARFGFVAGPRLGMLVILRRPAGDVGPARPHLLTWEPGVILEPSVALRQNLALHATFGISVAPADLAARGNGAGQLMARLLGGVTWAW